MHMICGRVGAGQTTYGRRFASECGGVFFCLDEWMATLFMIDAPAPITLEWALPRTQRCEQQIWMVARQLIGRGIEVVLELGFFTREQRDRVRGLAQSAGVAIELHVQEVPREVRRDRVRERNRGTATYTVDVDDAMFDWAESHYEDLGEDEVLRARVIGH